MGKSYYTLRGEVYVEDSDGPATYREDRPRTARKISEAQARDMLNRAAMENDERFEARERAAARERENVAAGAAQKRQALADWLAEAGAPPEVIEAL